MISSLFSGLSGVRSNLTQLEVIGNNISNTNTIGFKATRVTFKDIFLNTLHSAKYSSSKSGGIKEQQLGRGVKVGSIDTIFTQGSLQVTNKNTDLAIVGNGFFVLSDGANQYFTRAGDFFLSADGYLIGKNGLIVQGKTATNGTKNKGASLENIRLPINEKLPPKATSQVRLKGNLDATFKAQTKNTNEETNAQSVDTTFNVFDSSGNTHAITITFSPNGNNNWSFVASVEEKDATVISGGSGSVTFNPDGSLSSFSYDGGVTAFTFKPKNGANTVSITLDFGKVGKSDGITTFPSDSTIMVKEIDGYAAGTLESFNIDDTGVIHGVFSNGESLVLAQLILANFGNPASLTKIGSSLLMTSANSGEYWVAQPGEEGLGLISPGSLELSNVVLAEEFTNMILAQRGFQASANVITTTDAILGDIINIKRG